MGVALGGSWKLVKFCKNCYLPYFYDPIPISSMIHQVFERKVVFWRYLRRSTLHGSFWARDSSKKAFCSSWLALSNGVQWSRKAILVAQCTCKTIENFARAPRDEKSRNNLGAGWSRDLRQKLYPGAKYLGNPRNFCKQVALYITIRIWTKL